jgi:uncharacterized protein
MSYTAGRLIYDADCHIVEPATWLRDYADPEWREQVPLVWTVDEAAGLLREAGVTAEDVDGALAELRALHAASDYRSDRWANVLAFKQMGALGAFDASDRVAVLDELGFARQLVFNTFSSKRLQEAEATGKTGLVRAMAVAHNRAITDFCSADERLLPVGFVPLSDLEGAGPIATEAIEAGCRALLVTSVAPPSHGPTHVGLNAVWDSAAEAGVPVVMHVGGGGEPLPDVYNNTGRPLTPDFRGGEGTMRSLEVLSLPNAPKQLIAALVVDGVLADFPKLRIGVHEQGASWIPSLLHEMDATARAFVRSEPRLQRLELLPSEYVVRQMRVTPLPYDDVRWVTEQAGPGVCMFSSDYPHHEGGRDPIARYDKWLDDADDDTKGAFFADNFVDFVGGRP